MLDSILVPVDGSSFGEQAIALAASIARRGSLPIDLVHVHWPLSLPDLHLPALQSDNRRARTRAEEYLDGLMNRLRSVHPSLSATTHLLEGRVADVLCEYMAKRGCGLVVMSTHGYGPLSRLWFGSVTTELVQRSPAPLLLVRPRETVADLALDAVPRRFLIPLDGSRFAEQVIPPALALGALVSAEYRLLRVLPPVHSGSWNEPLEAPLGIERSVTDFVEMEAKNHLDETCSRYPGLANAARQVVFDWPAATVILKEADAHAHDLIALATHGWGGLKHLLLGSVADKVLRGTQTPVLVYRPVEVEAT